MQKRHQNYILAIIITLMCSSLTAASRVSAQTATWSAVQKATNEELEIFPDIAHDSVGDSHLVYTQTPDFNTSKVINYRAFRNNAWSGPVQLSAPGLFADIGRVASVTVNGQVIIGVTYKGRVGNNETSRIYYRQSNDAGRTWSGQEQVTTATSFEPSLTLDASGSPHITASQQFGADLNIVYATKAGAGWTNAAIISSSSTTFNRDTSLVLSGSAGNQTLHAVFGGRAGSLSRDIRVYYTRKQPGQNWTPPRLMQNLESGSYPDITSDGNATLNAVWQAAIGSNFEIYSARSTDNGATWSTVQAIGTGGEGIGQSPAIAQSSSGAVVSVWEDSDNTVDDKRDIYSRISTNSGITWGSLLRVNNTPGFSREVEITAGPVNARAVWHDETWGNYHIFTAVVPLVAATSVNADPVIENDQPSTNKPTVAIAFKDVIGTPRDIRWKWNKAPTDADSDSSSDAQGWITYAPTMQVAIPEALRGGCASLTLFAQTRDASGAIDTTIENDAITFDNAVQANVSVPSQYTATSTYNILITDTGDCSSLKDFAINQPNQPSTREPYPGAIQYLFPVAVPENTFPGLLPQSSVTLRDTMDNEATFPLRVYYDPPNVAGVANAGAPVLAEGGTLAVSSANSLQRTLTIRATVNDAIYNQATGKPFAGVLVAAIKSATPLAASEVATTSSLTWSSIAMPSAGAAEINFKYALNTNSKAPALAGAEGAYYLYVKFVDGAGNASTGTLISGPVTLAIGYTAIETFLPNVSR